MWRAGQSGRRTYVASPASVRTGGMILIQLLPTEVSRYSTRWLRRGYHTDDLVVENCTDAGMECHYYSWKEGRILLRISYSGTFKN